MRKTTSVLAGAAIAALLASCGGGGGGDGPAAPPAPADAPVQLNVLGTRPDLVSGGQALVEMVIPQGSATDAGAVKMLLNGEDVTASFAVRANGRYMGLVEGLAEGDNRLVAQAPNGASANLVIRNHPKGGPII